MGSEKALLDLVDNFYEAASAPQLWPQALQRLADTVRAQAAALDVFDFKTTSSRLAVTVNIESRRDYEEYFAPKNVLYVRGDSLLTEGAVLTDSMICPPEEFLRSEYYNDYLRPNNIRHMIGSAALRCASVAAILTLTRPLTKSAFSETDRRAVQMLMPHMQRALQLHDKFCQLEDERRDLSEALDLVAFGIVLVGPRGTILRMNKAADRMVRANDGISAVPEGLRIAKREQADALRAMLAGAAATARRGLHSGGALSVSRPSMHREYSLLVCPMRPSGAAALIGERPIAAIFITDPDAQAEPPAQLLTRLYKLTPAEARLAVLLMEGHTLSEAANAIGISRNTVHSQLMAIFAKTGTCRQSELIKLLISGPAQLRFAA